MTNELVELVVIHIVYITTYVDDWRNNTIKANG